MNTLSAVARADLTLPAALSPDTLAVSAETAVRLIPPTWPLAATVAVNPFLGLSGQDLAQAGAYLDRLGGVPVTMDRAWYQRKILTGEITDGDLAAALGACRYADKPADVAALKAMAAQPKPASRQLPTVAGLAPSVAEGWPDLIASCIGAWASGYFDAGQALWAAPRGRSAWAAWRAWATHDLTPEIMGLRHFAAFVADLPDTPEAAMARAVQRLGVPEAGLESYFHQLLLSLGGWAQHARYLLWTAELAGKADATARDLLAIRLAWEEAIFVQCSGDIATPWAAVCAAHAASPEPDADFIVDAILQGAAERAYQRGLAAALAAPDAPAGTDAARPALQAAFCIDVRSEVYRRALESLDPAIQTLGFAGFFGMPVEYKRYASDTPEARLPVLLNPARQARAGGAGAANDSRERRARYRARAVRALGRFKLAAVSSFAFVEAMGPVYVEKLIRDALGLGAKADEPEAPAFIDEVGLSASIDTAEAVLRAMSLTEGFAPVVAIVGHGARVINNPYASALQCGACGGHAGDVNARLLAQLLNRPEVRTGLAQRGISVPADTLFIAALHDTTSDEVTLFDRDVAGQRAGQDLAAVRRWFASAAPIVRTERARRLPGAKTSGDILRRARDWAEVRPEWGLAGCAAFIAAPRRRTVARELGGRVFLHDYDWTRDRDSDFAVLEQIITAPVVVASWIGLQYYGSAVAPETFGSGNKLLHNIVGGIGVVEGNGGNLRAGLPWQSVHDGTDFVHEPLRLSVCIAAPSEAISDILSRHPSVAALFDNGWLSLFALDDDGRMAKRYQGGLSWAAAG